MALRQIELPWDGQPQEAVELNHAWVIGKRLLLSVQSWAGRDGRKPFVADTTTRVNTPMGVALDVAGATKYVDIDASGHGITNQVTVCALASTSAAGSYPMILSAGNDAGDGNEGFELRLHDTTGRVSFNVDETTGRQSTLSTGNVAGTGIRFIAGRYDGAAVHSFLDDQKSSGVSGSGNIAGISNVWRIGNRKSGPSYPWTGQLVGLHVFASALTDQEIQEVRWRMWEAFAPRRIWVPVTAASGSSYSQNISGSLTLSNGLYRGTTKSFLGSTTLSNTINKNTTKTPLTSSITTTSGITAGGNLSQSTTGNITPTSVLTDTVNYVRNYSSSITLTGGIVNAIAKFLNGTISISGALNKLITKYFSGSITKSGSVSGYKFTPSPEDTSIIGNTLTFIRRFIGRR